MTERDMQAIRDDLSYLRALAAEGRTAPFLGGSILIAAGLLFGAAALVHWAIFAGVLDLPRYAVAAAWLVAGLAFFASLMVVKRRIPGRPGAEAVSNKASSWAWAAMGWAVFAIFIAFYVASMRTGEWIIMDLFACIIMALYGSAWAFSAIITRTKWLMGVALASYAMAVVCAWFAGTTTLYLIYAAALVLLAAVPGMILRSREPSETV